MVEIRFLMVMCDSGFLCRAYARIMPFDVRTQSMSAFANMEERFPEVAQWCEEHLGSKEGWVVNKLERRVYFYNLDDATLFKLRWC